MAFQLTYPLLALSIQRNTNRVGDEKLISLIPEIVSKSEAELSRACATRLEQESFVNGQFAAVSQSILDKPFQWASANDFFISTSDMAADPLSKRVSLELRVRGTMRLYWPNDSLLARPQFYADYGATRWLILPPVDKLYFYEISYKNRVTPIDDTNQTNWLTYTAPDAFENLCIANAWFSLDNAQQGAIYRSLYEANLSTILREQNLRNADVQQLRSKE